MIWKLTLQPRDIELYFGPIRGFFTKIMGPVALRVNQESRNTVKPLYPLCFGNVVYQPRVLFNFSIDTLFLEHDFQSHVLLFLASLKPDEMTQLRHLAVDRLIDEDYEDGEHMDIDTQSVIRKVLPAMTALEEIRIIFNLEYLGELGLEHPYGSGPMELYDDEWPDFLCQYHLDTANCHCLHTPTGSDYECDSDNECYECHCMDMPPVERDWDQLKGPKVRNAWGWRPVYFEY